MRTGVNNFFGNLSDVWSFANSVLQLKLEHSAQTFMRVNVNTVFGLGGLLDIATEAGIDRHSEDFGQTLGRWGVPSGPYVVLPLLGSSTVRDTAALTVDRQGDLLNQLHDVRWRNSLYFLRVIDARSNFLRASQLLDDAALDKYTFTRDAICSAERTTCMTGTCRTRAIDRACGACIPLRALHGSRNPVDRLCSNSSRATKARDFQQGNH